MIKIFHGEDRQRAKQDIVKFLGPDYEILEGANITPADLPSIFLGHSLFSDSRSILIHDLSENKDAFSKLKDYLNTPHQIALFETKIDKRSATYKELSKLVEIKEYKAAQDPNAGLVFDIYRIAKKDGKKAIEMLEKIKPTQDPMMFLGLLISQAVKDYGAKQGTKEKSALRALSKLDVDLKTTSFQPWLLIESFLLQVSSL